jgi:hypothetical protein
VRSLASVAVTLCLLSLPASAYRTVFKNSCEGKQLGDACNDRYSQSQPGTCVEGRCMDSGNFFIMGSGEKDVEPVWFDCHICENPEQRAERQWRSRLRLMLGALSVGGAATFVWYWRRRSRALHLVSR